MIPQDGSLRLRACDDLSASLVNENVIQTEKLRTENLDDLSAVSSKLFELTGRPPSLIKADVDAAYRRIPVQPDQRWLVWIVFMVCGQIFAAQHLAMPFGGVSSVYAWNKLAAFLVFVIRNILFIPLLRCVSPFP